MNTAFVNVATPVIFEVPSTDNLCCGCVLPIPQLPVLDSAINGFALPLCQTKLLIPVIK